MRIHFVSNSLRMNTGFGNVTKNLAIGLAKLGHDISMTGMQTSYLSDYSFGIECLPKDTNYVDDVTQIALNLMATNAEVVINVYQGDTIDQIEDAMTFKMTGNDKLKSYWYCPIEGLGLPWTTKTNFQRYLNAGGKIVAQCNWGAKQIKDGIGIEVPVIYHGFNDKIFKPLDDINELYCYYGTDIGKAESDPVKLHKQGCYDCNIEKDKCEYYKEEEICLVEFVKIINDDGEIKNLGWTEGKMKISHLPVFWKGKFVYLSVFNNFGLRKHPERLLEAYALMIKDNRKLRDRTLLHLHTLPVSTDGLPIANIVTELGIEDNVTFSYGVNKGSLTEEAMAILYNCADCHVLSSGNEGFGLSILESMACGIPNIGPNSSSFIELIGNHEEREKGLARGYLVNIAATHLIQVGSKRFLVDIKDLAQKMKDIYILDKERTLMGKNAAEWSKKYTWAEICKKWDELLTKS